MNLNEANSTASNLIGYFIVIIILTALWLSDFAPLWIPWLALLVSIAGVVVYGYIKVKVSQYSSSMPMRPTSLQMRP